MKAQARGHPTEWSVIQSCPPCCPSALRFVGPKRNLTQTVRKMMGGAFFPLKHEHIYEMEVLTHTSLTLTVIVT